MSDMDFYPPRSVVQVVRTCGGRWERGEEGGDDDDVYYYIRWRLKLEGDETENMGVCTKERKGVTVGSAHGHSLH